MQDVRVVDSYEHILLSTVLDFVRATTGETDDILKQHICYFYQFDKETFRSTLFIYNDTKYCVCATIGKVCGSIRIHYGVKNPTITTMEILHSQAYTYDQYSAAIGVLINEYLLTGSFNQQDKKPEQPPKEGIKQRGLNVDKFIAQAIGGYLISQKDK